MLRGPRLGALAAALSLTAMGCARYQPAPVDPAAHVRAYRAHRLTDSTLLAWVRVHAGLPGPDGWSERQLALVALAFRSDLERARRDWLAAGAEVRSAGGRPAPGAEIEIERAVGGREEASPWVVALTGLFTLELGGKRAARLQAARAREAAAAAELGSSAMVSVTRVRQALVSVIHAEQVALDAEQGAEGLAAVAALERDRYAEAAIGREAVARTANEVVAARVEAASARSEAVVARADLAEALAMPVTETRGLRVQAPPLEGCRWAAAIGSDSVAGLAVSRRPEIASALAEYAAAEAALRMEVAASYPSLELGPGFIWDQGVHRWTLGAALPAVLGLADHRPIAAAAARRRAAAAGVAEAQDRILAQADRATETCRGAELELAVADSQYAAASRSAAITRAAYDRGEVGRLEVARAELLLERAAAARRAAERRVERAGLGVEIAAAEWRELRSPRWPDPRTQPFPQEEPGS